MFTYFICFLAGFTLASTIFLLRPDKRWKAIGRNIDMVSYRWAWTSDGEELRIQLWQNSEPQRMIAELIIQKRDLEGNL